MRCYLHVYLLSTVFTFFFLLYVYSQLDSTLEDRDEWAGRGGRIAGRSSHEAGHALRKRPGVLGLRDREWGQNREKLSPATREPKNERSDLAVVACGPRLEETLTMLKSAILFSKKPLHFYIFAEDELHDGFRTAVNTDILFLRPVEDLWGLLSQFNASQLAAMAPEHEEPRIGWYNRFARHPYYGKTGVNSGVMLMNMTRIRERLFKVKSFCHWKS
ncbi:hypothetical protein GOODEAATRI_009268 [Goodea atripinnis]|uniref:Uncharacterized protein n=1 Tax=Goodea atripinnis TaxID=208336 RepID=A0ABV0N980_9TELE